MRVLFIARARFLSRSAGLAARFTHRNAPNSFQLKIRQLKLFARPLGGYERMRVSFLQQSNIGRIYSNHRHSQFVWPNVSVSVIAKFERLCRIRPKIDKEHIWLHLVCCILRFFEFIN